MAIKRIDLSQQYTNDMPRFPGMEARHIDWLGEVLANTTASANKVASLG